MTVLDQLRHPRSDQRPGKFRDRQHRERAVRQQHDRASYFTQTRDAIIALRNAGLTHNIMIDAANWGQDWSNEMRNRAMELWNADTRRNLTFSVHMYEVYQSLAPIQAYMQAFDDMNLPLVIGEFGPVNNGQPVDSESVIAQAAGARQRLPRLVLVRQRRRRHRARHDQQLQRRVADDLGQPHRQWHQRHPRDLGARVGVRPAAATRSRCRRVVCPSDPAAASSAVSVTANVGWTVTDDASWLSGAPASGANNGSFTVSATANTGTTSRTGTVTVTAPASPPGPSPSIRPASRMIVLERRADLVVVFIRRELDERHGDVECDLVGHRQSDVDHRHADQRVKQRHHRRDRHSQHRHDQP